MLKPMSGSRQVKEGEMVLIIYPLKMKYFKGILQFLSGQMSGEALSNFSRLSRLCSKSNAKETS